MDWDKRYDTEAEITKLTKKYLDNEGIFYNKISNRYTKGIADIIACVDGRYVAIELKRDKGKPSLHQLKFIKEIKEAGGIGEICYTLGEVRDLVDKARNNI